MKNRTKLGIATVGYMIFWAAWLVILALISPLNHDEHQFLTSGWLIRQGYWPWRDFPLFQMPLWPMCYAGLAALTNWLLLGGRLMSALSAWAMAWLLWQWGRRLLSSSVVMRCCWWSSLWLLAAHPILVYTAVKSWNHSSGLWFACLALAAWMQTQWQPMRWQWPFWSGVALALAAGLRLTYAVLGLPLLLAWLTQPQPERTIKYWVAGGVVGLLPSALWISVAPQRWYEQAVQFHTQVDAAYFESFGGAMSWAQRGAYLWDVLSANYYLPFSLGAILLGLLAFAFRQKGTSSQLRVWAVAMGAAAMLCWAAVQKVIVFTQYFYTPLPFLLVACWAAIASFAERHRKFVAGTWALWCVVALWNQREVFSAFAKWRTPEQWTPRKVHQWGRSLRAFVPSDTVLTLSPLYVLEGGGAVFPEWAASPFAWRTASFWPPDKRHLNHIVGPDELYTFTTQHHVEAVLTGFEPGIEEALDGWAQRQGFTPVMPNDGPACLWTNRKLQARQCVDAHAGPLELSGRFGPSLRDTLLPAHPFASWWWKSSVEVRIPRPKPQHEWLLVVELRRGDQLLLWRARRLSPYFMRVGQWQHLWLAISWTGQLQGNEWVKTYVWRPSGAWQPTLLRHFQLERARLTTEPAVR